MNPTAVLSRFYSLILQDGTVGCSHVSLYMAFYLLWSQGNWISPILVKREEVMRLAKMGSSATYHRCLRQLIAIGCLRYEPSANPAQKSKVYLVQREQHEKQGGNVGAAPKER